MHVSPQPRSYISGVLENRPQPPQPQPRRNRLLPTPASAAAQRPPLGPGPSAAGLAGPAPIRCPLLLQLVKLHPARRGSLTGTSGTDAPRAQACGGL
jgi:hypothetical protein